MIEYVKGRLPFGVYRYNLNGLTHGIRYVYKNHNSTLYALYLTYKGNFCLGLHELNYLKL